MIYFCAFIFYFALHLLMYRIGFLMGKKQDTHLKDAGESR